MSGCLTSAEIEGLVAGLLSPSSIIRAKVHVAACQRCRDELGRRQAADKLFDELKRAHRVVGGVGTAGGEKTETWDPDVQRPGRDEFAGYEILSEIHRGGQGIVYKAVQKSTKRTVALKILLHGEFASARQRHRFAREVDLIANLRHPNIVTVYDSGTTHDGRHYFTMEYIHGLPLDAYVLSASLNVHSRLQLFRKVCEGVEYAHQHGVIHRDLKPGNIRVDTSGVPHLLDFGLAKAAGQSLIEGIPVTVSGEFMGTWAYASPEQTKGDPSLIDLRTDVYSLGVILYKMLTNVLPYNVTGSITESARIIAEVEPKVPSSVQGGLDNELDTIVLRALAKERERRYPSAEALGRDIAHYLSGEPIDAKRDSAWYMLGKSARNYKKSAVVLGTFTILVAILAASFHHLGVQETRIVELEKRLKIVVHETQNQLKVDPHQTGNQFELDRVLADEVEDHPRRAQTRFKQAAEQLRRGDYDVAIASLTEIIRLDPQHSEAYANRGLAHFRKRDYAKAVEDAQEALSISPEFAGAAKLLAVAREKQRAEKDAVDIRVAYRNAAIQFQNHNYDAAIARFTDVIRLDPTHAEAYANRGYAYFKQGRYAVAAENAKRALAIAPTFKGAAALLKAATERNRS